MLDFYDHPRGIVAVYEKSFEGRRKTKTAKQTDREREREREREVGWGGDVV